MRETTARILTAALAAAGLGLAGVAAAITGHADPHHQDDHGDEAAVVRIDPSLFDAYGITVATAAPGPVDTGLEMLGEVRANGDRVAHLVPRFPGIVRDVTKTVGDRVVAGDVLAVIESNQSLAPYELRTLTPGVIIARHITRGEAVDRDRDAFVIADLSTVWIDLSVYQRDMGRVAVGQRVHVRGGRDMPEAEGTIAYLTPTVDQPTRTLTARVVLPNPDGRWRPGLFVTARVLDPTPAAVVVPRTAIQRLDGRTVVFVAREDGWQPREVGLGRTGTRVAEIVDGLRPGERYVATGSFVMKAELGKGEAGHEH